MQYDVETIETDLRRLAHRAGAFERPEALAGELKILLDLVAVRVASGQKRSNVARVPALEAVLRSAVDRIRNKRTRAAAAIYFCVLSSQELADLELDTELRTAGLGERRQAIQKLLALNRYRGEEETRIRVIVAGELALAEAAALSTDNDPEELSLTTEGMHAIAVSQAVRLSLERAYDDDHSLRPLASLVVPDRLPFYETNVDVVLEDTHIDSQFVYDLTSVFSADLEEYTIGLVARPSLTDVILATCPRVTDVYSCSNVSDRDKQHTALSGSVDVVTLITTTSEGRTHHSGLKLEPVPAEKYADYLGELEVQYADQIRLLSVVIPRRKHARLRTRLQIELRKSDHFCYWVADRPIYLRRITFDIRSFTPPASDRLNKVTVQPFSMAGSGGRSVDIARPLIIDHESWLVRGQGYAVIW